MAGKGFLQPMPACGSPSRVDGHEKVKRGSFLAVGAVACGRILWNQGVGPTARSRFSWFLRSQRGSCGRTLGVARDRAVVSRTLSNGGGRVGAEFLRHLRHSVILPRNQQAGRDASVSRSVTDETACAGARVPDRQAEVDRCCGQARVQSAPARLASLERWRFGAQACVSCVRASVPVGIVDPALTRRRGAASAARRVGSVRVITGGGHRFARGFATTFNPTPHGRADASAGLALFCGQERERASVARAPRRKQGQPRSDRDDRQMMPCSFSTACSSPDTHPKTWGPAPSFWTR